MASVPRLAFPKSVVFVTSRVEEGLPFTAACFLKLILWSVLARAQSMTKVKVCHFVVMTNHIHLLLVVEDPDAVAMFMDRFKTESAHFINRLLGRRRRTVWCAGYHCAPCLTVEDVLDRIVYIYANPASAHLTSTIAEYPGVNSWHLYHAEQHEMSVPWIRRSAVSALPNTAPSLPVQAEYSRWLRERAKEMLVFVLSPNAWMDVFEIMVINTRREMNREIKRRIEERERQLTDLRNDERRTCVGGYALRVQALDKPFTPKKWTRRGWCFCYDVGLRKQFIAFVKWLREKGREARRLWAKGDLTTPYVVGLFPPALPRLVNLRTLALAL